MGIMDYTKLSILFEGIAAIIKAAGLYVLVPSGILYCIFKPPEWIRISLRKAKLLGAEVELDSRPVVPAAPEPLTLVATTTETATVAVGIVSSAETSPSVGWYESLRDGRYKEGMEILREEASGKADFGEGVSLLAFGMYVAFHFGTAEAFNDLKAYAETHATNPDVHFWLARAYEETSQHQEAIEAFKASRELATKESDRVDAVIALAILLIDREEYAEARTILISELAHNPDARSQSRLYRALATLFEKASPEDKYSAMLMYEQAIRYDPHDASLLFSVAYKYSENGAPALALFHYRALLGKEKEHERALANNNAGVAAENLALPIFARAYQKNAVDLGSTLAMSNLASGLLGAGFLTDAKDWLTKARKQEDVHRRVEEVAGDIAQAERTQEAALNTVLENVSKARQWRVKHAEALLSPAPRITELVGEYEGTALLVITLMPDGTLGGSFHLAGTGEVVLTARLEGAALSFAWATKSQQHETLLSYSRKTGHGLLIVEPSRLRGYALTQGRSLDAAQLEGWADLEFRKKAAASLSIAAQSSIQ